MKPLPQISEAEYEVMRIVWQNAPVSTNEIVERLEKTTSWNPKTIQTLIKRLVTKRALTYEKEGRMFVYTPLVAENEYVSQESSSFLKNIIMEISPRCCPRFWITTSCPRQISTTCAVCLTGAQDSLSAKPAQECLADPSCPERQASALSTAKASTAGLSAMWNRTAAPGSLPRTSAALTMRTA